MQTPWCSLSAAAAVVLAGALPAAQPRTTAGSASARPSESVVDEVRERFAPTRGWFRIVAGGRFEVSSRGALTPVYRSLTHSRVRRADAAGHSILPTFAERFTEPMRAAIEGQRGVYIDVAPLDALSARARVEDGLVVYPEAWTDTDVMFKSTPTHVDEYLLLRSRYAPTSWRYRVSLGPELRGTRQTPGAVEVLDARGVARLRANRPTALDSQGRRITGDIRVDGASLLVTMDLRGAAFPVLVDPDWRPTGDMAFGRFYNGAQVLPDGRVVVTGGCSASVCSGDLTLPACRTVVATAETLDLATRTWSRAGDDPVARFFHGSESLPDGSVLVAGGCTDPECASATADAQQYDPAAREFRALPSLSEARAGFASVRLADGRVMLAGGCTATACSPRVEIFDPARRSWTRAADLSVARGRATATLLASGAVLVAGGCTTIACAGVLASAEVYDPITNQWTAAAPMGSPRGGHYAAALLDGRVIVGGGCPDATCTTFLASTELFDASAMQFSAGPTQLVPRVGARALRLPNDSVMLSQGCQTRTGCDLSNELLDARASAFLPMEGALTIRAFHEAVLHGPAGLVIAIGGCQPRTCSWWNETYEVGSIRPIVDAGAPGAAAAARDSGASSRDAATRVTPPPPSRGCGCRTPNGAPTSRAHVAIAALSLAALGARRRRVGRA